MVSIQNSIMRRGRYAQRDGNFSLEILTNLRLLKGTDHRILSVLEEGENISSFFRWACECALEIPDNDRHFLFENAAPYRTEAIFVTLRLVTGTLDCIKASLKPHQNASSFLRGVCEYGLHLREVHVQQRAAASEARALRPGRTISHASV